MKHQIKSALLILSSVSALLLTGCGETPSTVPSFSTSSLTSVDISKITSIEIAGPSNVETGKNIKLVADVIGSDDDSVTWSSSDESIATVDATGRVTGVAQGKVTITATSVYKPDIHAECEISVNSPIATALTVKVFNNEDMVYDDKSRVYSVPLGQSFDVSYSLADPNLRPFDEVTFEVSYPSDVSSTSAFSLEKISDTVARVHSYDVMTKVGILVRGFYEGNSDGILGSAYFNIVDSNSEKNANVLSVISDFADKEDSLLSSKISRTYTSEEISSGKKISTIQNVQNKSYLSDSYAIVHDQMIEDGSLTDESYYNYFSGIDKVNKKYYAFSYDPEGKSIDEIVTNTSSANYLDKAGLTFDMSTGLPVYGISGLLKNNFFTEGSIIDNVVTLGNSQCYAYANYDISSTKIDITSNFHNDDLDKDYDLKLSISLDQGSISGYVFNETVTSEENKITYTESLSDLVFGTKTEDTSALNTSFLDLNIYYIKEFNLVEVAGTKGENDEYDYTDLTKYGANDVTVNAQGLTKYSLTFDKTLVIQVQPTDPISANTELDMPEAISSDITQIPSFSVTGGGIFAISAKKNDQGNPIPGDATFTIRTTNGVEKKIEVQFIAPTVKGIVVGNISDNKDLGEIFVNKTSNYFFLNTDTDELTYHFGIEIVEGDQDGIEMVTNESGNIHAYPGGSFSIKGLKAGTYSFKFVVLENKSVKSETYTITIRALYTASHLASLLVGEKYAYSTGLTSYEAEFTTDKLITITREAYGEKTKKTVAYHFEEGAIMVDEEVYFGTDFYFDRIQKGEIDFSLDLSSLDFLLEMYDSEVKDPDFRNYNIYRFKLVIDKSNILSYLDGKTFSKDEFIYGTDSCKCKEVSLAFNGGDGKFRLVKDEDSSLLAEITFKYTYSASTSMFVLTSVQSTNPEISLNSIEFNQYNSTLRIQFNFGSTSNQIDYSI